MTCYMVRRSRFTKQCDNLQVGLRLETKSDAQKMRHGRTVHDRHRACRARALSSHVGPRYCMAKIQVQFASFSIVIDKRA